MRAGVLFLCWRFRTGWQRTIKLRSARSGRSASGASCRAVRCQSPAVLPAKSSRLARRVDFGVRAQRPMLTKRFQAELLSGHKENAVQVPFDPGATWSLAAQTLRPGRRGFPVVASLNGVAFESAIVARSGKFWLLVPATVSESAKLALGEVGSFTAAPSISSPHSPSNTGG